MRIQEYAVGNAAFNHFSPMLVSLALFCRERSCGSIMESPQSNSAIEFYGVRFCKPCEPIFRILQPSAQNVVVFDRASEIF